MQRLLIAGAAVMAVLALAACGGGGSDSSNSSDFPPSSNDTTLSVEQIGDAGRVLVDSAGKALYAADQEADNGVLCTGGCLSFWQPLTIDAGAPTASSVPGTLGVSERPDGSRQVTHDGRGSTPSRKTRLDRSPGTVSQTPSTASSSPGTSFAWAQPPNRGTEAKPEAAPMGSRNLVAGEARM
jgi:predicted lipoprotein with Yx(FWY)xxD motif